MSETEEEFLNQDKPNQTKLWGVKGKVQGNPLWKEVFHQL